MLEHAWPGDCAIFGHVTDDENRNLATFCQLHQFRRHFAHLRNAAGRTRDFRMLHRLNGINNHKFRFELIDDLNNRAEVGFRIQIKIVGRNAQAFGPHFDLQCTFFP